MTAGGGSGCGEVQGLKEEREGLAGPFESLDAIRGQVGIPTSRFCLLIGLLERTWQRWSTRSRRDDLMEGPWPQLVHQPTGANQVCQLDFSDFKTTVR